jgi:hypothetical protein
MEKRLIQSSYLSAPAPIGFTHASVPPSHDWTNKLAFLSVCFFTVAVYGRPEDIFHIPFHFQMIFGAMGAIAFLLAIFQGKMRFHWYNEVRLVLILTAWFVMGIPFAYWKAGSFNVLTDKWLKTLLIFVLLTQTLTSVAKVRKLLWAIVLSEFFVICVSLALQGGKAAEGQRMTGVNAELLGWNFFGIAVAITLPYIAALYITRRSIVRTAILLATLGLMMWMLVLTGSRGGFLNVVLSFILTGWFVIRGSGRGRMIGICALGCLLGAVAMAPGLFLTRIQTIWTSSEVPAGGAAASAIESTEGREWLLERAMLYTRRYPVFGVGIGNFPVINGNEIGLPTAWYGTHNTYTQLSSEAGVPALILFLSAIAVVLKHLIQTEMDLKANPQRRELRILARATIVSLLSFVFGGFFVHVAYDFYFYYPIGIGAALWGISRKRNRRTFAQSPESEHEELQVWSSV